MNAELTKVLNALKKDDDLGINIGEEAMRTTKRIDFTSPWLTYIYSQFKLNGIHRLHGVASGGKSSLATYFAAECQRNQPDPEKRYVAYIDFERTFDVQFAKRIGLDIEKTIVIKKENIEEAVEAWKKLVVTGAICCTIFDSDATAPTRIELQEELGKATFGAQARIMGMALRQINLYVDKYSTPFILISQERANMAYGAKLPAVSGGFASEFYASTRCRCTKGEQIEKDGEIVGIIIKIKNYKNKTGRPYRSAELHFYFDGGFDVESEYFDFLFELEIFKQSGSFFSNEEYGVKFQGRNKVKAWLDENPEIWAKLKKQVIEKLNGSNKLDESIEVPETYSEEELAELAAKQENGEIVLGIDESTGDLVAQAMEEETKEEEKK